MHPVRLLNVDGVPTFDHAKWATAAVSEFERNRWVSVDRHDTELFTSLEGDANGGLILDEDLIDKATQKVKRPMVLDSNGACVQAIRECPEIQ